MVCKLFLLQTGGGGRPCNKHLHYIGYYPYPCTMGFGHLALNLFYGNDYVNSGNNAVFSLASRESYIN